MKLWNFNPQDGSFDYIAHEDGTPAITFYRLGTESTHFQVVTGGAGSVNLDAKTFDGETDVDIGLWPQAKAGVYVQSETRPNWLKVTPSDEGDPIVITTGGAPYDTSVAIKTALQAAPQSQPLKAPASGSPMAAPGVLAKMDPMTNTLRSADRLQPLRENGLQILRGFFTESERADLLRQGQEVIEGVKSGAVQRQGQFALGLADGWFSPAFANPRLLDLISEALGPNLCIALWRVLMKDHHFDGPISIHQDAPYFGGFPNKLNAFIPLTPVGEENGGLVFYERSHWLGPLERGAIDADRYSDDLSKVCPELEVGDVLLADFLTWHYSEPARLPKDRVLFQFVYQQADDPSSAHLLRGERRNPFYTLDHFGPMLEPLTHLNILVARGYFEGGDFERAERFTRGILSSQPDDVSARLLISDILTQKGDEEGARRELLQAQTDFETLKAELERRAGPDPTPLEASERVVALEKELAEIKSSRSWRLTAPLRRRG